MPSIDPYGLAATGLLFAPGSGVADVVGFAPSISTPGEYEPSMMSNIGSGQYMDAGLQGLGLLGDAFMAAGTVVPPLLPIGAAMKLPRAGRVANATIGHNRPPITEMSSVRLPPADGLLVDKVRVSPEIIRKIASGYNSNPKTLAKRLRKEGLLNVEDKAQQDAFYAEFNRITDLQDKRRAAKNKDDRFGSFRKKRDQLNLRRKHEAKEQELKIVENSIEQSPMFDAWTKPNRERVLNSTYDSDTIDAEARLATVEAIAREAKKRGLEVYYTSKGQRGRSGSRYIELPDGGKVRISDHELPDTAQRQYTRSQGIGNFADEIIVSDWETSSVDDYLERILGPKGVMY